MLCQKINTIHALKDGLMVVRNIILWVDFFFLFSRFKVRRHTWLQFMIVRKIYAYMQKKKGWVETKKYVLSKRNYFVVVVWWRCDVEGLVSLFVRWHYSNVCLTEVFGGAFVIWFAFFFLFLCVFGGKCNCVMCVWVSKCLHTRFKKLF